MSNPASREELLLETAEAYIFWSGGRTQPWVGTAATDPSFIEDLIVLAACANKPSVLAFCEKYKETE